ncbi:unnamed protein product [Clonostachys rhizophaga]|uniref:Uncharacterized protein n=1 Tax=Clonostachys rhizophaga TaxID=160324 RepID=A0A9N9W0W5_9HYPO|nr:unnamed protein product [Clonostachys rhizophaga]
MGTDKSTGAIASSSPPLSTSTSSPAIPPIASQLASVSVKEETKLALPPIPWQLAISSPPSTHRTTSPSNMDPRPQGGNSGSSSNGSGTNGGTILDAFLPRVETRGQGGGKPYSSSSGQSNGGQSRSSVPTGSSSSAEKEQKNTVTNPGM